MKKSLLVLILMICVIAFVPADELDEVISPEDGMIEYFFFIDGGWNIDDPYTYDWYKDIDNAGDEYVVAISASEWAPKVYIFYNLSEEDLEIEYDYWTEMALSLKKDKDDKTTGTIEDSYIFVNLPNDDRETFPFDDYIGHKIHFIEYQHIPYTKFNYVLEYGSTVFDF